MFPLENSTESIKTDEYLFANGQENTESMFSKDLYEPVRKQTGFQTKEIKDLYSSSLKLVQQKVDSGSMETALAFLETYHVCHAISLQALDLIFPELRPQSQDKSWAEEAEGGLLSDRYCLEGLNSLLEDSSSGLCQD